MLESIGKSVHMKSTQHKQRSLQSTAVFGHSSAKRLLDFTPLAEQNRKPKQLNQQQPRQQMRRLKHKGKQISRQVSFLFSKVHSIVQKLPEPHYCNTQVQTQLQKQRLINKKLGDEVFGQRILIQSLKTSIRDLIKQKHSTSQRRN